MFGPCTCQEDHVGKGTVASPLFKLTPEFALLGIEDVSVGGAPFLGGPGLRMAFEIQVNYRERESQMDRERERETKTIKKSEALLESQFTCPIPSFDLFVPSVY